MIMLSSSSHSSTSYVIPNYYRGTKAFHFTIFPNYILCSNFLIKGFLKACPTSRSIDTEELHDFARQIARGMEHLENKGITHRFYLFKFLNVRSNFREF